jgi:hypothetical protein
MNQLPRIADRVASFRNRLMREAETVAFAVQDLELRYAYPALAPIRPELFLLARRPTNSLLTLSMCKVIPARRRIEIYASSR